MCGIIGVFDLKQPANELREDILDMAKSIRHRGPDWSGLHIDDKAILPHLVDNLYTAQTNH
jgi:asparagine synthase (glutamine-hydrolysing)